MLYCFNFGSAMLAFQSLSLIEKLHIVFYQFMHGSNHFLMCYFLPNWIIFTPKYDFPN